MGNSSFNARQGKARYFRVDYLIYLVLVGMRVERERGEYHDGGRGRDGTQGLEAKSIYLRLRKAGSPGHGGKRRPGRG